MHLKRVERDRSSRGTGIDRVAIERAIAQIGPTYPRRKNGRGNIVRDRNGINRHRASGAGSINEIYRGQVTRHDFTISLEMDNLTGR